VASNSTNQNPELSGNVLFYKNPQPLSASQHGGLGIKKVEKPFEFLKSAHAVPITVSEFGVAATSYPIIFVGKEMTPLAVMGVRQNENLYVNDNGQVDSEFYVPAFARRYPFVFASDPGSDRMILCVDRDAPMVTNKPETPFFDKEEPTDYTTNAIEFCKEFERHRRNTSDFIQQLTSNNLLEQKTVSFQPRDEMGVETGENQKIADYWAVDENRLKELPPELYLELKENGALGVIYAHIVSLMNWQRIIQRALRVQAPASASE